MINEPGSIRMHPTVHEGATLLQPQQGATLLQPQIGVQITAAALIDEDGSPTGATYQWQRSSSLNRAVGRHHPADGHDGDRVDYIHATAGGDGRRHRQVPAGCGELHRGRAAVGVRRP